jgi:Ca2+/H+ antiporter
VAFWIGTESPLKNFRETDSSLIRGILLSSFLTGVGALFGVVVLWGGRKKITQRPKDRRDSLEGKENGDKSEGNAKITRQFTWLLAVFPVIFPCLYYMTHADLRYRHPIDPIVSLLTVIAVAKACGFAVAQFGSKEP